jgi:hypothetical protein
MTIVMMPNQARMVSAMRNRRVQTVIVSLGALGKIEDEDMKALLSNDFQRNHR